MGKQIIPGSKPAQLFLLIFADEEIPNYLFMAILVHHDQLYQLYPNDSLEEAPS